MMALIRPVVREISGHCGQGSSAWYHSMLTSGWAWAGGPGGMFALFQEMENKDAHLFATLQTRKNALLACPFKVVAGDDSEAGQAAARTVENFLGRLPHLNTVLFHLLDALAKGFAVAEIIWDIDTVTGEVRAKDIRARNQAEFAFDGEGQLYLLDPQGALRQEGGQGRADLLPRPGESSVWAPRADKMPERKFLHFSFQGNACSPYGSALCIKAYWYYWLKKNTLNHWALFNEKFGSPTAVARYSASTADDDIADLQRIVSSLPHDSGVLLPEGVNLEFLEARRSAGANTYRELADWCNDEISKIVLGQTLTTSEGRRSGSMALGRVHESVRRDYLASDAAALGQVLTSQLARWITDFNYGPQVATPRIVFDVASPDQFEAELAVDRELVKMGIPLPAGYFYERYRRPVPLDTERVLRYDDANLYQYHLLHGVLTINEVRKTLGLDPVAWGDRPTGTHRNRHGGDGLSGLPGGRDADPDDRESEPDEEANDGRIR